MPKVYASTVIPAPPGAIWALVRDFNALGVENYHATFRLSPVTDVDHTFAEWDAQFDAAPEREDALVEQIGRNVFAAGLQSLKERFSS